MHGYRKSSDHIEKIAGWCTSVCYEFYCCNTFVIRCENAMQQDKWHQKPASRNAESQLFTREIRGTHNILNTLFILRHTSDLIQ